GVAGGEEGHQAPDQVAVGRRHLHVEVARVHREIHFLDGPGVPDRVAIHLVEAGVAHRAKGEFETGVEERRSEWRGVRSERRYLGHGGVPVHYRETVVWKRAMQVAREVYRVVRLLPREEMYGMRAQMTRAAISVPSN